MRTLLVLLCWLGCVGASELDKAVRYVQKQLPQRVSEGVHYLPPKATGLPYAIEHDPATGRCFIGLEHKQVAKGSRKLATVALLCDRGRLHRVARIVQKDALGEELAVIEALRGQPGIVPVLALTTRPDGSTAIYAPLYTPLHHQLRRGGLSVRDKVQIAMHLMRGLESLHACGYIHGDIKPTNMLVRRGRRGMEAAVTDFGGSLRYAELASEQPTVHRWYRAPECFAPERLRGTDYPIAEVYAMGCVLYRIWHGGSASWQRAQASDEATRCKLLRAGTDRRRRELARLPYRTVRQSMELLILRMIHPNPAQRGTAVAARRHLEHLCHRAK